MSRDWSKSELLSYIQVRCSNLENTPSLKPYNSCSCDGSQERKEIGCVLRLGGRGGYKEFIHTVLGPTGPRVTGRTLEIQENGCKSCVCHLRGCLVLEGEGQPFCSVPGFG